MTNKQVILLLILFLAAIRINSQTNCIGLDKDYYNLDTAIAKTESCIATIKNDTINIVNSTCYLSSLYCKNSQYTKAEKALFAILNSLDPGKHKILIGIVYEHLGNCYKLSRETATALKYYFKAAEIFEQEKKYGNLVNLYVDIAEYYRSIGLYGDGKRHIKKALNIYDLYSFNDTSKLIRIYNRFAAITNESSNSDSCLVFSLKAIDLSRKTGDLNSEAVSLNEIGFAMKNRKNIDSSMKCYKRAITIWTEIGYNREAVHAKYNLAMLLSHNLYSKKELIPIYKDIIKTVEEKKIDYPLDQVYFGLSDCYFFSGDSLNCYRTRQKAFTALLAKNQKVFNTEVNNIKEKYENKKYQETISKVADELITSEHNLLQKRRENRIIYISLIILFALLIVIGFLSRRIFQTNKTLNIKNKEKDGLIQEIHHRVKNNLQFVSSLINMQMNSSKSSAETDSLSDASRRIRSMALVHEMLYNQNNMDGIEIKKYLEELVTSINDIVNSQKIPVKFLIECEECMFETPKAIAIGMITSELVSNSIKYAFNNTKAPLIKISLKKTDLDDNFTFTVSDNGKGLIDLKESSTEKLGMRLISIFSRQIKGSYSFKNLNGLVYTLFFKINSKDG